MGQPFTSVDTLCINTLRTLAIDAIENADSGHPGLPLGAAPMAYVLWNRHLKVDPQKPKWIDRDRFVLSAGHGSSMLYSLLHLSGFGLSLEDLKSFRQWGSRTPGHPEAWVTEGVEATTGPLGQGAANAVGMAIAERALANRFNKPGHTLFDHYTYALVGDGDLMEGVSMEACSLAGHLKLGKLVFLYDANDVTLDGPLSLSFSDDVAKRFESMGWQAITVQNGNTDLDAIDEALGKAKNQKTQPTIIIVKTTIGFGAPNKQGKSAVHGSPLGKEEIRLTKEALGWTAPNNFHVPAQVYEQFKNAATRNQAIHKAWHQRKEAYQQAQPELAAELERTLAGKPTPGWENALPHFAPTESLATRQAGGKVINAIAAHFPFLLGGDADLSSSTGTAIKDGGSFDGTTGSGRNIRYGIREHAMGAIANGIAHHGILRPFVSTFFVFSDYMRPPVRLAAMGKLPVIYVWTHDSIALGEDGPTHQPVEQLAALRAMPNLTILRPADANETTAAWKTALEHTDGPVALVLSRQKLPVLDLKQFSSAQGVRRGAYVLRDSAGGEPQALIVATGSEVHTALLAQSLLENEKIRTRVVSMPSWELFAGQDKNYQDSILLPGVKARVGVEAGVELGWSRWLGENGVFVGVNRFGASAPEKTILEQIGPNPSQIVQAVRHSLAGVSK